MANGYAAVSIEDIARVAKVSRVIVYRHFETKEGAYIACVQRARAAYEQRLAEAFDPALAPRERLKVGAEVFFEMLEDDPGRWRLLFGSNAVLPGEYAKDLGELRFGTIRLMQQQLEASAPDAPELAVEAAAHAISGVGERLGHWWLVRPDLPREELVRLYVEFIWTGVAPYIR